MNRPNDQTLNGRRRPFSPSTSARLVRLLAFGACLVLASSGAQADERLTREAAAGLLEALKSRDAVEQRDAIQSAAEAKDERFIAPLIELLRADDVGAVRPLDRTALTRALQQLSGQSFGDDWPAWVTWYAATTLEPPPGFTGWKGQLLSRLDARFGPILATGMPSRIRVEEIVWGGVGFEGIPALESPATVKASEAGYLRPDEPVFGLTLGGESRAYPLRVLDWHEMANDTLGGIPVSLAYCTLCGAGIVYDRRGPDGTTYDFGSSGLLMRSNKLMVDRQTRSLWDQFTGRPVVGPLVAGPDFRLKALPSVVTTWRDWRRRHPDTTVLSLETGHSRNYEPGAAYAEYFADPKTMFPVRATPRLSPKTWIFGLESNGDARAYPIRDVTRQRLVQDRVGKTRVALVATRGPLVAEGRSDRTGVRHRYAMGAEVRAYAIGQHRFDRIKLAGGTFVLLDENGSTWTVDEKALVGPDGARLSRLPGVQAYWFAWSLHHADTSLYSP